MAALLYKKKLKNVNTNYTPPKRFVILDRDGVINVERGDFTTSIEEWEWAPNALEGVKRLTDAGYGVIVATNQSCIARGILTEKELAILHDYMLNTIRAQGGDILKVYHCPHRREDNCSCRKPKPGMLLEAAEEFGFKVKDTFLIGDMPRDREAAERAGMRFILVEHSHNQDAPELADVPLRARDLLEAAELLIDEDRQKVKCVN